jgi:hypothetical protein
VPSALTSAMSWKYMSYVPGSVWLSAVIHIQLMVLPAKGERSTRR